MRKAWVLGIQRYSGGLLAGGLFAVANAVLVAQEKYFLPILPLALGCVLLALFSLDKLIYLISFLTPLSIGFKDTGLGAALSVPSEALLIMASLVFVVKLFLEGSYPLRNLLHPVSVTLLLMMAWWLFTSITSTMPLVSFKSLVARLWFVVPMYFLGLEVFRKPRAVHRFMAAHLAGLALVIGYTTYRHYLWNFEKDPAHWVMTPFYNDHTAYGMVLALTLPFVVHFALQYRMGLFFRLCTLGYLAVHLLALRLSNSRAAWLSVVVALGVWALVKLRVRWYVFSALAVAWALMLWSFRVEIQQKLARNKEQSSEQLEKQIRSITNISTDPSNLERFNRWKSALRMFSDKPHLGFGPGTYQFQYAPYQSFLDLTIISTNAGNQGTAHSEYLLALSEQGWPGMAFWLISIILTFYYGNKAYHNLASPYQKNLVLAMLIGLVTYWAHAFLNNFLDTDKAAVPYYALTAILVSAHLNWTQSATSWTSGSRKPV
ncbi:MAG: O-antigen ligase family protein [Flavobacteriales bacterium]|nr:O-antigen ligase family protein [Flavobacteriales bacterium]MDW8410144.1 O-antigen ligase family protein [Flavobacteriales bacterium]